MGIWKAWEWLVFWLSRYKNNQSSGGTGELDDSGWGGDEGKMKSDWGHQSIDDGYLPLSEVAANARRKPDKRSRQSSFADSQDNLYPRFAEQEYSRQGSEAENRPKWNNAGNASKGNDNMAQRSRISVLKGDERVGFLV